MYIYIFFHEMQFHLLFVQDLKFEDRFDMLGI
jgi:hypothetical protein